MKAPHSRRRVDCFLGHIRFKGQVTDEVKCELMDGADDGGS